MGGLRWFGGVAGGTTGRDLARADGPDRAPCSLPPSVGLRRGPLPVLRHPSSCRGSCQGTRCRHRCELTDPSSWVTTRDAAGRGFLAVRTGRTRAGRGTRTREIVMQDFRAGRSQPQELGSVGRRRRAGHGQPDHAGVRRRRQPARQAGRHLRSRHPVRRQGPAARRRAHQPGPADVGDRASSRSSPARSTTPTTSCSCRCRRRRSGTAWPTSSTTTRCTTGSRPATSGRTGRCTARSTRWPRASSGAACCSTSPA